MSVPTAPPLNALAQRARRKKREGKELTRKKRRNPSLTINATVSPTKQWPLHYTKLLRAASSMPVTVRVSSSVSSRARSSPSLFLTRRLPPHSSSPPSPRHPKILSALCPYHQAPRCVISHKGSRCSNILAPIVMVVVVVVALMLLLEGGSVGDATSENGSTK